MAKYTGLFALARRLTAHQPRILAYHGIWLGDGHFGNFLFMKGDTFARRMALLRRWGYPVVPLAALETKHWEQLPDAATVITIDDGWAGTYSEMLPALEAQRFPATVYLTTYYCLNRTPVTDVLLQYCFGSIDTARTSLLDLPEYRYGPCQLKAADDVESARQQAETVMAALPNDAEKQAFLAALCQTAGLDHQRIVSDRWFHLMTPDEAADAAKRGIDFELHTHRHRVSHHGESCITDEVETNRKHIQAITGRNPRHFCYPSGHYTPELWPELQSVDVLTATTTEVGLVNERSNRMALRRILDGQDVSELAFEAEMSGFLDLIRRFSRNDMAPYRNDDFLTQP